MTTAWPTSVPGTPTPTDRLLERLLARTRAKGVSPGCALASLAEALLRSHGSSLAAAGLRLAEHRSDLGLVDDIGRELLTPDDDRWVASSLVGPFYEAMLDDDVRARRGTHLTSAEVAAGLFTCVNSERVVDDSSIVLDPSVGGGAFLLAAANQKVAAGCDATQAWNCVRGVDIDPVAVAATELALAVWLCEHGHAPHPHPGLEVGDALLDQLPDADVVVGNPPFLSQLRSSTAASPTRREALRDRWGPLVGAYTDEAWLFLVASLGSVSRGGLVSLLQPVSVLAARHARGVRDLLHAESDLVGLWLADGRVFEAAVEVCAPILRHRSKGSSSTPESSDAQMTTRRWSGAEFRPASAVPRPEPEGWGRAGADLVGIPQVHLARSSRCLGDLASATAGFRDQFYGFVPFVSEASELATLRSLPSSSARPLRQLVTVGMIDPFQLRWGRHPFRFAGQSFVEPVVDMAALADQDPRLHDWVAARSLPKVLVATQTRIIEGWVDIDGTAVPATPVISVEPRAGSEPGALFSVLAALSAPQVSADCAASTFGTAMSVRALKLAARDLAEIPLPTDRGAWADAARRLASLAECATAMSFEERCDLAEVLSRLHGRPDPDLVEWWVSRWPSRPHDDRA